MNRYLEYTLDDNSTVRIEVEPSPTQRGTAPVARVADLVEKAQEGFEEALENVRKVANRVADKMQALELKPAKTQVQFGLKFTAEAGAIVAKTAAEAQLQITLVWERATVRPDTTSM